MHSLGRNRHVVLHIVWHKHLLISLCISNKKRQDSTDGNGQAERMLRGSSWSAQAEEK